MSIQVEEQDPNQLVVEEEGEKMQDRELAQQIKDLIEVADMELERKSQDEDIFLMPNTP